MILQTDADYMSTALQLAARGRYTVSPNPMVGCVLVKDRQIIGQGFHVQTGGPHAEIAALKDAGEKARGSTAYVTLEPCCHHGRTPPCTDALIQAGIKKVVVACVDPNPLVAGKGLEQLKNAGIEIEIGICEKESIALNEIFFHYMCTQQPFVIAKWAMSLDGKTVTHPEDSRDISSAESQKKSHLLRQQVDAILIGANTAANDNPELTVRYPAETSLPIRQPLRIILASQGNLPLDLNVFRSSIETKTLVVTTSRAPESWINQLRAQQVEVMIMHDVKINLPELLKVLGKRKITSLLVEGGMTVLHDFFQENLVNKIHVYLAPTIIGSLKRKQVVNNINLTTLAQDFFITADSEGNNHV